jgi:hypothetical protein
MNRRSACESWRAPSAIDPTFVQPTPRERACELPHARGQTLCALAVASLAVALGGCAGPDAQRAGGSVYTIPLDAGPSNLGEIGQAAFAPQGNGTSVFITLSGVPDTLLRPVHLYTYVYRGSCGKLEGQPAFALNDVVLARPMAGGSFTLIKLVPMPLDTLRAGTFALSVRSQAPDLDQELFCGTISNPKP